MTGSHELTSLLRRLWGRLSRRRQRQFAVLLGLMLVSAFSEVVTVLRKYCLFLPCSQSQIVGLHKSDMVVCC